MANPNMISTYQTNISLSNNYAIRLEVDWSPQNGTLQGTDILATVEDDELLIFVDGVQVASVPSKSGDGTFLRYGR